jgi:serine/threonine protein kinase
MIELPLERAEDIYYSALEIQSPAQRDSFLERACQGDTKLRSMVDKLLAAQPKVEKFFQEGGVARLPLRELSERPFAETPGLVENTRTEGKEDESLGKTIGPYKLLQKIGEGGCGVVYMAEQEKPVRRRVAFKIIKLGMDTKGVVARFEAERQALALMDHPNIARVLDAGATESGRPYFVMELVRGVKITEYCDQNELDPSQRLKLFIQVCQAIQHAHQKGVIHRDIKPSNILVTIIDGLPVPKVIDFGIAKAIEGRLTDNTIFTAYEQFIGTPAYMSPEQAVMSGVDVDTRSDIYSLGVLLYELLTGRTPFETKYLLEQGIDGMRRTLREEDPKPPSTVITTMKGSALKEVARSRHAEPVKLISLLRGDLDWIVIRALEKDRNRRYQTANGLAMDAQRFLDNEPVFACPPSRIYRLQKLVRRNKVTFVAGTTVAAALLAATGVSTFFWYQESQMRKQAVAAEQMAIAAEQRAENRARISEAAYSGIHGKFGDADILMSQVSDIGPSLDAEQALRSVGTWYALKGQWAEAAKRFTILLEVDQKDKPVENTYDLLIFGPIQIENGDLAGYERFRQEAVARFADTTDPVVAERTLKISLLTPPDPKLLKQLELLSEVSAHSMGKKPDKKSDETMIAWRCISLALMAYRQGYTPTAKEWCDRCLQDSDNLGRKATAHVIKAMSCYQLGETNEAVLELADGRKRIDAEFEKGLTDGPDSGSRGYWFDWLFARILLREADGLIKERPQPELDANLETHLSIRTNALQ